MRILIAHTAYQQAGGEDGCVTAEAALLRAHGHHVEEYRLSNSAISDMSRIELLTRTFWSRSDYAAIRRRIARGRFDILHCHNSFPLMSPAIYYAAREAGAAVVQTLHNFRLLCPNGLFFRNGAPCESCLGWPLAIPGIAHGCYRDSRAASAVTAGMVAAHRSLGTWTNAVDAYIALSEFSRAKFIAGGLTAERVFVKPNFLDPDPGPGDGSGGFALFAGRLSHEKGVATLLEAWSVIGNRVPLVIAGDGPMADAVRSARIPGLRWLGLQSADQIAALMAAARMVIVPSSCYENFPRVIIEAFARGTPVIAAARGSMAEIVPASAGALFKAQSANDLAEKVLTLDATSQRGAARQLYLDRYTGSANHARLMEIYAAALARRAVMTPPSQVHADPSHVPAP